MALNGFRGHIRLKFEVCDAILSMLNSGQNLFHPMREKLQSLSRIIIKKKKSSYQTTMF